MRTDSLSFLIPAYNNAGTVSQVVNQAQRVAKSLGIEFEIVVLDDASRDQTLNLLTNLKKQLPRLRVLRHEKNQGYGATIRDLYYAGHNEWLFSLPADNQIDPGELRKLWPSRKQADIVVGRRIDRKDNPKRLFQSKVYNVLLQLLFRIPTQDVNSVRLMRSAILKRINLRSRSAFVDAQLVIQASKLGFKIKDVAIGHLADVDRTSGGGRLATIWPTIVDLVQFLWHH